MSPKRPLPMRFPSARLRLWMYHHFYRARRERWASLYEDASLYLPGISMKLVLGDYISDQIALSGMYEPRLTRRVLELGRQGGTMIDVGANLGYFSLLWAACNPANRCFAFEAAPRNLEILRQNISRNGLEHRIRVVPCAASAETGKVRFQLGPSDQTGWGGIAPDGQAGTIEVEALRVDSVVPLNESIELLKIDTEGADALVLQGCEHLLRRKLVREIWFEQNKPRMSLLKIRDDQAPAFLESMGYACKPNGDPQDALIEWSAVPTLGETNILS